MSYKTIIVHIDSGNSTAARIAMAARLASAHGAHLIGVHAASEIILPVFIEAPLSPELVEAQQRLAAREAEKAEKIFTDACRAGGITAEWRRLTESAVSGLTVSGRYADLVVVGQRDPDETVFGTPSDLAEQLVFDVGRPILVVPYTSAMETIGRRVLVAWNGSREATRAVNDALPVLAAADAVTVLTLGSDADTAAEDLCVHLTRHGVKAEATHLPAGRMDAGELILSRAADLGIDLMVMGAYGHSRFREMVLGGVTRTIFEEMTVPVLMSH